MGACSDIRAAVLVFLTQLAGWSAGYIYPHQETLLVVNGIVCVYGFLVIALFYQHAVRFVFNRAVKHRMRGALLISIRCIHRGPLRCAASGISFG